MVSAREEREKDLRRYDGFQFRLTEEEAVRKAVGFRLQVEMEPFPRIHVYGRTIAAKPKFTADEELWREAFEYIVDLGPAAYGVCLQ